MSHIRGHVDCWRERASEREREREGEGERGMEIWRESARGRGRARGREARLSPSLTQPRAENVLCSANISCIIGHSLSPRRAPSAMYTITYMTSCETTLERWASMGRGGRERQMEMESRERERERTEEEEGLVLTCSRTGEINVSQALKLRFPVHTPCSNVPSHFTVVVDWIGDANPTAVINRPIHSTDSYVAGRQGREACVGLATVWR